MSIPNLYNRLKECLLWLIFALSIGTTFGQTYQTKAILFYNVENLFDTENDSLTQDDDFTPEGNLHWTKKRYYNKLKSISNVILDCNGWNIPFLIGLAEIENQKVVSDLLWSGGLFQKGYKSVQYDSPDPRGIDVALLYNSNYFKLIISKPIPSPQKGFISRDILYAKGVTKDKDTLHIFVCHFPSRRGGQSESAWKRGVMAKILHSQVDSILTTKNDSQVLIMGDFNDTLEDASLSETLLLPFKNGEQLITAEKKNINRNIGSHKYQEEWISIDHIFFSDAFADSISWSSSECTFSFVQLPYLFVPDETYGGNKLFRTYLGPRYLGGYSDHLPVMISYKKGS